MSWLLLRLVISMHGLNMMFNDVLFYFEMAVIISENKVGICAGISSCPCCWNRTVDNSNLGLKYATTHCLFLSGAI